VSTPLLPDVLWNLIQPLLPRFLRVGWVETYLGPQCIDGVVYTDGKMLPPPIPVKSRGNCQGPSFKTN